MNTEVAGFTRKTGVFFAYSVDGPEFPPALYHIIIINDADQTPSPSGFGLNLW